MSGRRRRRALFTADGKLGNQLFQAAFLDRILARGDRLITMGMEDLIEGFHWERYELTNIEDTQRRKSLKRWLRRLGRTAVKLRLVSGIRQRRRTYRTKERSYRLLGPRLQRRRGLFSNLLYIDKGYFQSEDETREASFRLKGKHLEAGRNFLATLPDGPRAFVHMRRGDYAHWKIFGRSPLLSVDYVKRGMALVSQAAPDTKFILVSNDVESIRAEFDGIAVFKGANVYEDFGLMTLCDGGVVSNSTLSWWGAYFCKRRLPIISPRNWLAAGLDFEYPTGITAPWMTPIDA